MDKAIVASDYVGGHVNNTAAKVGLPAATRQPNG